MKENFIQNPLMFVTLWMIDNFLKTETNITITYIHYKLNKLNNELNF